MDLGQGGMDMRRFISFRVGLAQAGSIHRRRGENTADVTAATTSFLEPGTLCRDIRRFEPYVPSRASGCAYFAHFGHHMSVMRPVQPDIDA